MLPVIYQSGYLTIKDFEEERVYTLDFPNMEIEKGFLEVLLRKFVKVPDDDMGLEISNLKTAIRKKRHRQNAWLEGITSKVIFQKSTR